MTDKPKFEIKPEEGSEVCDFCTAPYVHAAYPCDDFVSDNVLGFEISSRGPWAACAICAGMIDREEWKGLLERSVRKFCRQYPIPYEAVYPAIARNHMLFRQHRKMVA